MKNNNGKYEKKNNFYKEGAKSSSRIDDKKKEDKQIIQQVKEQREKERKEFVKYIEKNMQAKYEIEKRKYKQKIHKEKIADKELLKRYNLICIKTNEQETETKTEINHHWKDIQELLNCNRMSYLKAIRRKIDFCQIIDKTSNQIVIEGNIYRVLSELLSLVFSKIKDDAWKYLMVE